MKRISTFVRHFASVGTASLLLVGGLAGCVSHPPRNDYVVFFDTESVTLSATAKEVVANAVDAAHKRHITQITVSGSAGKTGDAAVLKELADARAKVVIALLQQDGVAAGNIHEAPFVPATFEDSRVALRRVTVHLGTP